jgi:quinol monooxygenase YgiN
MSRLVPIVLLAVLALVGGVAAGQDKEHPIVAQVKPKLKDANKPFTMIVVAKLKDGASDKFEAAFAKALKGTRKEKGYYAYDLNRDVDDPNRYLVYERWRNLADLEAHLKAPHLKALLAEIGELLEGPPEVRVLIPVGE